MHVPFSSLSSGFSGRVITPRAYHWITTKTAEKHNETQGGGIPSIWFLQVLNEDWEEWSSLWQTCSTSPTRGLSNWYIDSFHLRTFWNFQQGRRGGAMTRVINTTHLWHDDVGPTKSPQEFGKVLTKKEWFRLNIIFMILTTGLPPFGVKFQGLLLDDGCLGGQR